MLLEAELDALDDGRFPDEAPPRLLPEVRRGPVLAQAVRSDSPALGGGRAAARRRVEEGRAACRAARPRARRGRRARRPRRRRGGPAGREPRGDGSEPRRRRGYCADRRVDDDRSISAQVAAENPAYYKIPPGHNRFIESVVGEVKSNSSCLAMRRRSVDHPPDADLKPEMLGAMTTHVFAPHLSDGKPKPPCPYGCGWTSLVVSNGWDNPGRRVLGLGSDEWLVGATLKCRTCECSAKAHRDRAPEDKRRDKAYVCSADYFSDESRRRRGCDVDIPSRQVAATRSRR